MDLTWSDRKDVSRVAMTIAAPDSDDQPSLVTVSKSTVHVNGRDVEGSHDDTISCVATSPTEADVCATGSMDGTVKIHQADAPSTLVCTTSGMIRCVAFSPIGDVLAIGGDSLRVTTTPPTLLPQPSTVSCHLAVTWLTRNRNHLATVADDGHLRVYDVDNSKCIHDESLELATRLKRDSTLTLGIATAPFRDVDLIAVPTGSGVVIFKVDDGTVRAMMRIKHEQLKEPFAVAFAPRKRCIVADASGNRLLAFKLNPKKKWFDLVDSVDIGAVPSGIYVTGHLMAVATKDKTACTVVLPKSRVRDDDDEDEDVGNVLKDLRRHIDDEAEEGEEDDDAPAYKLRQTGIGGRTRDVLLDDDEDMGPVPYNDVDDDDDDEEEDKPPSRTPSEHSAPAHRIPTANASSGMMMGVAARQHPFVTPGATPPSDVGCYLCYNMLGYATKAAGQVTIHFHDVSRLPVRVPDPGFHTAAIGQTGAILASTTSVTFKAFQSFGANADWSVTFPASEEVELVSVGGRHCVISTSKYVRVLTTTGIESSVFEPTGRVVCIVSAMASRYGEGDVMALIYASRVTSELSMDIMNVQQQTRVLTTPVPSRSGVAWAGFSGDGHMYIVDGCGVLRMLSSAWGHSWLPMYDPEEDSVTRYWIWGVAEETFVAYALQYDEQHPALGTTRAPEHVKFRVPVAPIGTEKHRVQREWVLRYGTSVREAKMRAKCYSEDLAKKDLRLDTVLFEMFRACVDDDLTARALDISCTFELRATMESAVRYAHSKHQNVLLEKLHALLKLRFRKSKRSSDLPEPGMEISEKDKEMLYRKVIMWERERANSSATGNNTPGKPTSDAAPAQPSESAPPPTASTPPRRSTTPPGFVSPPSGGNRSSNPKAARVEHKPPSSASAAPSPGRSSMSPKPKVPERAPPAAPAPTSGKALFRTVEMSEPPTGGGRGGAVNPLQSVVATVSSGGSSGQAFVPERPTTIVRKKAPAAPKVDVAAVAVPKLLSEGGGLSSVAAAALSKRQRDDDDEF
eukprot:PhM_4_TR18772/c0_g1_i1/m.58850/K11274/WDHD1, CTF4; chromosome transmission fidelity protein 4